MGPMQDMVPQLMALHAPASCRRPFNRQTARAAVCLTSFALWMTGKCCASWLATISAGLHMRLTCIECNSGAGRK